MIVESLRKVRENENAKIFKGKSALQEPGCPLGSYGVQSIAVLRMYSLDSQCAR